MEHPLRRPELLVCAWRGHELPGARLAEVEAEHDQLVRVTVDGRRFARCLRCDSWVLVDPPAPAESISADELAARVAPHARPRRGAELREAIVLRLIAVDRAVHSVAFAAVALAAL